MFDSFENEKSCKNKPKIFHFININLEFFDTIFFSAEKNIMHEFKWIL